MLLCEGLGLTRLEFDELCQDSFVDFIQRTLREKRANDDESLDGGLADSFAGQGRRFFGVDFLCAAFANLGVALWASA
jgi:hypothetical protein